MDRARHDEREGASAFVVAFENYEHHQRLDNLSASAGELAQAALIDFSRPRPMQKVEALTTINALGHAAGSLS